MELLQSMFKYISTHLDEVGQCIGEHLYIMLISVVISFAIAIVLAVVCKRFPKIGSIIISFFNMAYAIPSLAILAFLLPYLGLGSVTAITCIVLYEQFLLLKSILAGFDSVNEHIIEAGKGMGMNAWQLFFKVRLPLAMPAIVNGLKLGFLCSIGLAVLGAFVSAGGLGSLIYDGFRRNYTAKIVWGTILSTMMAVIVNQIFERLEILALKKAQGCFVLKRK